MMISKKYTLWALNPLLLTMMAPAVAQQTDDETFVVSANRSNRTVAEMAQTTGYRKRRTGTADSGRQKSLKTHWLS
ncbi:hypothetical protein [Escherichia coli]|uniref:hypothetical protein n=1 Tax=Escherichia coli TaxID=562 RepID=UPI0038909CC9